MKPSVHHGAACGYLEVERHDEHYLVLSTTGLRRRCLGANTISWAATWKAPTRHATTKSRCTKRCSGKIGSCATYLSTNRKQIPKTTDEEKRIQIRGCVQGTCCPPILRAIKKLVTVIASVTVPEKSTRLSFRFSDPTPWPGKSFWGPSSFQTTKRMATSANGHWMRNDLERDQYTIAIFPNN